MTFFAAKPAMNYTGTILSILTILLSAFTGWFTAWIAIEILFRPRKPVRVAGMKVQGIFPNNQQRIAEKLAMTVNKELIGFTDIEQKVSDPENLRKIRPEIEAHVDYFLRHKLKEVFPMLSSLMGEKTILQLKDAFLIELESLFPVVMKSYMNKLQHDVDLEKVVIDKFMAFSSGKLEGLLRTALYKEFAFLKMAGFSIGLVTGIAQLLISFLIHR